MKQLRMVLLIVQLCLALGRRDIAQPDSGEFGFASLNGTSLGPSHPLNDGDRSPASEQMDPQKASSSGQCPYFANQGGYDGRLPSSICREMFRISGDREIEVGCRKSSSRINIGLVDFEYNWTSPRISLCDDIEDLAVGLGIGKIESGCEVTFNCVESDQYIWNIYMDDSTEF